MQRSQGVRLAWRKRPRNRDFARRGTHYTRMILPRSVVSFLYSAVWRKTTKRAIILDSLHNRISNFTQVCELIFLSLCCSLVLWYIISEKFWDILLCFPIPDYGAKKPTWRSRGRWLAKLAWYDVTWKPSMLPMESWTYGL